MVHPGAIHPLTPGSPAYSLLKVGAVGGIFALRFALTRRQRANEEAEPDAAVEAAAEPPQRPQHPVSRRKKRRRRRG